MEELLVHRTDHRTFTERLQSFYIQWRHHKHDFWGSADFFTIATPPPTPTDDLRYLKSSTFHSWLLGYEFSDTLSVFGDKQIHFLCNNRYKARLLESITKAVDVDVVIHTILKVEDETSKMHDIVSSMRMSKSDAAPIVGCIVDESPKGRLAEKWADKLSYSGFLLCDVTYGLINLFAMNDPDEQVIDLEKEECRRRYRAELVRNKNEENARRLADRCNTASSGDEPIAYLSVDDLPRRSSQMMIQVDSRNKVVLLPIYGIMVPFHLSTVRRVSILLGTNDECYLRINFKAPHEKVDISVKDVSFRSNDPSRICDVVQLIKKLTHRRNAVAKECESYAERPNTAVVSQTDLVLDGNKSIRLSCLCIHPPLGGGSASMVAGALEAHVNGFRYSTSGQDEKVDVMYANIDHAFYQTEEMGEMNALLHLRLHNHIVVGNKKTKDVQFFIDEVETLEEGEKRRINMEFQDFVNKVNGLWLLGSLQFEQTLEEHGFFGQVVVSNNSKGSYAFVVPTSSCLVVLKSSPFLVIKLSEIEIVNLERIEPGERDFDMVIVLKDFKRDVVRVETISSWSFQGIKAWLHATDIEYFERRVNLEWGAILKTFIDDPQVFVDLGGWGFLAQEPKRQRLQL